MELTNKQRQNIKPNETDLYRTNPSTKLHFVKIQGNIKHTMAWFLNIAVFSPTSITQAYPCNISRDMTKVGKMSRKKKEVLNNK